MSKKMMIFYSFPINFSLKILNDRDFNDRTLFGGLKMIMTLHDRILGRNKKNDRSPHIEMSGRFSFLWLSQLIIKGRLYVLYPMQLVTPSVVAIAVRMLMAICRIVFQVFAFIFLMFNV